MKKNVQREIVEKKMRKICIFIIEKFQVFRITMEMGRSWIQDTADISELAYPLEHYCNRKLKIHFDEVFSVFPFRHSVDYAHPSFALPRVDSISITDITVHILIM